MDNLSSMIEQAIKSAAISIAVDFLARKFRDNGVTLSARQRKVLHKKIETQDFSNLRIPSWQFWKNKRIAIEITRDDLAAIEVSFEKFTAKLSEQMGSIADDLATATLTKLKRDWREQQKYDEKLHRGFYKRLNKRWAAPINLLAMMHTIASEFGANLNKRARATSASQSYKTDALTRLHARVCQVCYEVLVLLRHGLADGAMARWRIDA
jgi:hypothetical protein